jgi:VWFA-related protein
MLRLSLIVLAALPFLYSQTFQFKRGQAVYVFAARDSNLFTMNPTTEAVRFPTGKSWQSDGEARVWYPHKADPERYQWEVASITFLDWSLGFPTTIILPLPAAGAGEGVAAARSIPGGAELDRITPDPEIKSRIEKEFVKRKEYVVVDSPEKADFVFLAEGTHVPMHIEQNPSGNGVGWGFHGDYKAEYLQTVFAIVVPAAAYNTGAIRSAALMDVRLWEGSATWRNIPIRGLRGFARLDFSPASPEAVAAQFHHKEPRPFSHFPLCAASTQPLRIAGPTPANRATAPEAKKNAIPPNVTQESGQKPAGDNQAIRVEVTLVTVPAIVSNQEGKYVPDLSDSEFHVFEDNVEQKIDRIIPEAEPFDVAFMIDTSDSMLFKAKEIQNAAQAFAGAIRPADRLMIVSFDNRVVVHSELPADRPNMRSAISRMHPMGEGTRLYDAIDLVLEDRLDAIRGRKAIMLFTDGVDTRSRIAGASDTLAAIEESNVLVYGIQYDTKGQIWPRPGTDLSSYVLMPEDARDNTEAYRRADKYLFNLCATSGGALYVAQSGSNLNEVFAGIGEQLRHQYVLCYYRSNSKQDGAFHRLRVTVNRPGVKVRARTGYRAR